MSSDHQIKLLQGSLKYMHVFGSRHSECYLSLTFCKLFAYIDRGFVIHMDVLNISVVCILKFAWGVH